MILFLFEKKRRCSEYNDDVIVWLTKVFKRTGVPYRTIYINKVHSEDELERLGIITPDVRFVFWSDALADKNIELLKKIILKKNIECNHFLYEDRSSQVFHKNYTHHIVLLRKETVMAVNNCWFNELKAINNNLTIMYLDEKHQFYNDNWNVAMPKTQYLHSRRDVVRHIFKFYGIEPPKPKPTKAQEYWKYKNPALYEQILEKVSKIKEVY